MVPPQRPVPKHRAWTDICNIPGTPCPPLLKGVWGQDPPKIESLGGGVQNVLLEMGYKPEKGIDIEMGSCHFSLFYYSTVQLHLLCEREK